MKSIVCTLVTLFLSTCLFAQDWEFGPLLNYESTTFTFPDDNTILVGGNGGRGIDNLGRESNFSFGVYATKNPIGRAFYGVELFYGRHTASETEGVTVDAINFIPHFAFDFFDIGLYIGAGIGVGYIINTKGIDETPDGFGNGSEIQRIDIPVRIALSYPLKNIITLEAGLRGAVTSFEKQAELKRNSFFVGIKVPLSEILKK